jgi:hypothetical protein
VSCGVVVTSAAAERVSGHTDFFWWLLFAFMRVNAQFPQLMRILIECAR